MEKKYKEITLRAPAKINLFLEITGKRSDGYHDIESIMMSLDELFDTITLKKAPKGKISLDCRTHECQRPGDVEEIPEGENLAFRAAEIFLEELAKRGEKDIPGIKIEIEKRIPVRAGLGGGSADAGAVLRGLNSLFEDVFTSEELCAMGLRLGADVPFCTSGEKCALCLGVGEKMTSIKNRVQLHGIITAEKGEKPSTAAAYKELDAADKRKTRSSAELVRHLEAGDETKAISEFYNVFEGVCDYGNGGREILEKSGASTVLLSGAGPSVFAFFDGDEEKEKAAAELASCGFAVYKF